MLQRGTGECLISIATHPEISRDILANCGALLVFKTHMQREFLCELLNLNKEKQDYLSILEEGQCMVRVNSIKRPFLLSVPYIERSYLNSSEINDNNKLILDKFEKMEEDYKLKERKIEEVKMQENKEKEENLNGKKIQTEGIQRIESDEIDFISNKEDIEQVNEQVDKDYEEELSKFVQKLSLKEQYEKRQESVNK